MKNQKEDTYATQIRRVSEQNGMELNSLRNRMPVHRNRIRSNQGENSTGSGFFALQAFLCVLLLAGFLFMKAENRGIGTYDSADIVALIQSEIHIQSLSDD